MRVAVYTLTMNRLLYTQQLLLKAQQMAGVPVDWYVFDQGSTDGTAEWLASHRASFKGVMLWPQNIGICKAGNIMAQVLLGQAPYDLLMKVDNDCEMRTENWLKAVVDVCAGLEALGVKYYAVSPRVTGIGSPVRRIIQKDIAGHPFGQTQIVGGISMCMPSRTFSEFRLPEIPCHTPDDYHGSDDYPLCRWTIEKGGVVGYIEDVEAHHFETTIGQAKRFPEYFAGRKDMAYALKVAGAEQQKQ
ncbi:MAG: glycosyltransferase [Verrucomicrobia bacterium]|nr:glycosyltransferase [Verrucomicrobiota bacterium]